MNEATQPGELQPGELETSEPAAELLERHETEQRFRSGASWFYWVAGLSLVNSVISLAEGGWSFLFGLGITQGIDALALHFAEQSPGSSALIRGGAFALAVLIAGLFGFFGWLATRRHLWAFWIGGLLYLGDAVMMFLVKDWLGLAFHGWVLFALFRGYQAGREVVGAEAETDPFAAPDSAGTGAA